jgi:hypothetical protein
VLAQLQNAQNKLYANTAKKPAKISSKKIHQHSVGRLEPEINENLLLSPSSPPAIVRKPSNPPLSSIDTRKSFETFDRGLIDSCSSSDVQTMRTPTQNPQILKN